jgi:hypothetical protein
LHINEAGLAIAHCENLVNTLHIEKLRALNTAKEIIESEYKSAEADV